MVSHNLTEYGMENLKVTFEMLLQRYEWESFLHLYGGWKTNLIRKSEPKHNRGFHLASCSKKTLGV